MREPELSYLPPSAIGPAVRTPPRSTDLFVFSDGSFREDCGQMFMSYIARRGPKRVLSVGRKIQFKLFSPGSSVLAEYGAVLMALLSSARYACGPDVLRLHTDCSAVIETVSGFTRARDPRQQQLSDSIARELGRVKTPWVLRHVKREQNWEADSLLRGL